MINKMKKKINYGFMKFRGIFLNSTFSIIWIIKYKKKLQTSINSNIKIEKMKIYKLSSWHLGWKYFIIVDKNMKKYFVKIGSQIDQIKRESDVYDRISNAKNYSSDNFVKSYGVYEFYDYQYLIIEWIDQAKSRKKILSEISGNNEQIKKILCQINRILECFSEIGLVHRDIRDQNLLFKKKEGEYKIVVIDFATSLFKDEIDTLSDFNTLKYLGDKKNPIAYLWDDAYSFVKWINQSLTIDYKSDILYCDFPPIYERIGDNYHLYRGYKNEKL